MTPIADLELSHQLSALRVPPPDNGFEARLRAVLLAETPVAAPPQARVLFSARRQRPLALIAVGTLAFAGAAAASLDGRVWQAIVAVTAPSAPRVPSDTTEQARRARRPAPTEPAASAVLLNPPIPPVALYAAHARPAHTTGEPRSRHESSTLPSHPEATSSRRDRPEPAPAAGHAIPRLDLGDLPRGNDHADNSRSDAAAGDRLRDLARKTDGAESARERATDARERATDRNRGADRPRRPLDAPTLDAERERRGTEARDQAEAHREGRTERGRAEREGH